MMECKVEKFQSPGKGNGLWVTETVPPGELLYVAEPFAYAVNVLGKELVCETCLCSPDHLLQCARCKFAKYCSKRCQAEAWPEHKYECKCLQKVQFSFYYDPIRLVGKVILKLLRQQSLCPSEELYSVSELETNYNKASEDFKKAFHYFAEMLKTYLKPEILDPSEVLADFNLPEYFSKVTCNRFPIFHGQIENVVGFGLYPSMALLNHSCEPNCAVVFNGRHLHLRAITKIHIGDELTITYFNPLMPTGDRQAELRRTYCFDCDCRRCLTRDKDENMMAGDKQASDDTKALESKVKELHIHNKWEESLALCRAQLKSNAGRVPDENIFQLKILYYAMEGCLGLNMSEEALQYGHRLLEPYRLYTSGFGHFRALPMIGVGTLQCGQGNHTEARKTLNEAFEIMKISYGMDHPMTQTLITILQFCKKH